MSQGLSRLNGKCLSEKTNYPNTFLLLKQQTKSIRIIIIAKQQMILQIGLILILIYNHLKWLESWVELSGTKMGYAVQRGAGREGVPLCPILWKPPLIKTLFKKNKYLFLKNIYFKWWKESFFLFCFFCLTF